MKLSKSKLALAKVINENGGWPSDEANFAAQDKIDGESNDNTISFYSGKVKPTRIANESMWRCENLGSHFIGYEKTIRRCKLLANWHQTCLSREEYYQAYPKADADGWLEWSGGMKSPVESGVPVDVKTKDGSEHYEQLLSDACWNDNWGDANITAYRLHNPEVKPGICESVTRSTPEPESKPTIEQLAADYRNKLEFANRKQLEAEDAKVVADYALAELERAGDELGLRIGIASNNKATVIESWRDLRVGDIVFIESMMASNEWSEAMVGRECTVVSDGESYPICFANNFTPEGESYWIGGMEEGEVDWRFVRRP